MHERLSRLLPLAFNAAQVAASALACWRVFSQETGWPERIYLALIGGFLALALYVLTRRPIFSLTIVALGFYAILRFSAAKLAYLRSPLRIDDAVLLLQPGVVPLLFEGYPGLAWVFVFGILASIAYTALAIRLERPVSLWRPGGSGRGGRAIVAASAMAGLSVVIGGPGPLAPATADKPALIEGSRGFDLVSHFFGSIIQMGLRHPAIGATPIPWAANGSDDASATVTASVDSAHRPDIVVILEESTFDPQAIFPFCTPDICERKMFGPSPNSLAAGPLRVHVAGGLTTLSEFALFTGLPHSLFGTAGLRAPLAVLPRVNYTLPRWLKALGYRSIVVYPLDRGAFGGLMAYRLYGFDDVREHPMIGRLGRGFWGLRDGDIFHFIEQVMREEDAKAQHRPLFIYALTLQQHGPHGAGLPGQPLRDERQTFAAVGREANAMLNDYLQRLTWSDEAIRELDAALGKRGRPYVLAHFGDHHPAFEGLMQSLPLHASADGLPVRYETYYHIQAGGPAWPGRRIAGTHKPLDIAFLGGLLLDVAGLPKDTYFTANALLRRRCDGLFLECADQAILAGYQQYVFDTLEAVRF